MDTYLEIAQKILRSARRPLTARSILSAAYRADIVPHHLHGKTQHKTLQARLSEHILHQKRNSVFFRTEPGLFFLTEFLSDQALPLKYRQPFPARRRTRDLLRGPVLAVADDALKDISFNDADSVGGWLRKVRDRNSFRYADSKDLQSGSVFVWSFAIVFRKNQVLSYRGGRYRDDRDTFANKRTIGFTNVVHYDHRTFFNLDDFGIMESATTAVLTDLDIPTSIDFFDKEENKPRFDSVMFTGGNGSAPVCLAIVYLSCPDWYEPTSRRLSLNDLEWLDITKPPNHIEDFDPWSRIALARRFENLGPT